jgi:hypothetical protein
MAEQRATDAASPEATTTEGGAEFAALLNKEFKPQTDRARTELLCGVQEQTASSCRRK